MARIVLLIEEAHIALALRRVLERRGHRCDGVSTVAELLDRAAQPGPESFVVDARALGDAEATLASLAQAAPTAHRILLMDEQADGPRPRGANTLLERPLDLDAAARHIEDGLTPAVATEAVAGLDTTGEEKDGAPLLRGRSAPMKAIRQRIQALAPLDLTVLVTGESGTGKELVARMLHEDGPRRSKPFVAVHCGAIPSTLLESELFGHAKGAFTDARRRHRGRFQQAEDGTLLLDEIGEMPLQLQAKLLRAVQEREIQPLGEPKAVPLRARIVAATHRDLGQAAASGAFRADLYYRLQVAHIHLPPLREHMDDLDELVRLFVRRLAQRLERKLEGVSEGAMKRLREHPWPGNVRELEHTLQRAVVLAPGPWIQADDLSFDAPTRASSPEGPSWQSGLREAARHDPRPRELETLSQRAIAEGILEHFEGDEAAAARAVGIPLAELRRRLGRAEGTG